MPKRPPPAAERPPIQDVLDRAAVAVREGRPDEAVETLRQATRAPTPHPLAFLELGDLLGQLGRHDEGIAALEAGLAREPDAIILRVGLGYLHLGRNDRAAAREQFQHVRAAAPDRYDGMVGLAHVLASDGDHAGAAELYRRALGLQPDNLATRLSFAKCLLELGDREAGEAALRAAAGGSARRTWPAITALAATPRGRVFLRPSAAAAFLRIAGD